ncbi:uncharacterized protein EDB93DRAFT_7213 [Suillus bovinus]|uniref:uncharacterized protein n=1 Tax=Suillus bovinus TaxID=48563 RepID=UPI001B8858B6|nr:uncharacterized protein EDB93DRAFT_7213 [Suillus bovinus]KAG2159685.1 hypothetical protein EDB93DRAFT_7213 [Suillus bovinus]
MATGNLQELDQLLANAKDIGSVCSLCSYVAVSLASHWLDYRSVSLPNSLPIRESNKAQFVRSISHIDSPRRQLCLWCMSHLCALHSKCNPYSVSLFKLPHRFGSAATLSMMCALYIRIVTSLNIATVGIQFGAFVLIVGYGFSCITHMQAN